MEEISEDFLLLFSLNSKLKAFHARIHALKTISSLTVLNTRVLLNYLPGVYSSMFSQLRSKEGESREAYPGLLQASGKDKKMENWSL